MSRVSPREELRQQLNFYTVEAKPVVDGLYQIGGCAYDCELPDEDDPSLMYERYCLQRIAWELSPEEFLLVGPNFLNFYVRKAVRSGIEGHTALPDIMLFDLVNRVLRALYEIKSGNDIRPRHKITGFDNLLGLFRANPEAMDRLLAPIRGIIDLPNMQIPGNSELEVIFLARRRFKDIEYPDDLRGFTFHSIRIEPDGTGG